MVGWILFVITFIGVAFCIKPFIKAKKREKELEIYESITKNILNTDIKTRKQIEKLCNEYLEHKVINSKIVNEKYLEQCNLILDNIKFINLINSVEPVEPTEPKKSVIEKAIESNKEIESEKKGRKSKKEEKK